MKNIDYDSILSGLQRKRLENANLTDTRRNEVYNRIRRRCVCRYFFLIFHIKILICENFDIL